MQSKEHTATPSNTLTLAVVGFMAVAAALGTGSLYPLQPSIANISESLHESMAVIGLALALGPVGYLVGLAVLVPAIDRFQPRRVVAAQFVALAIALSLNSLSNNPWALALTVACVGALTSVGAQLSSVAGRFAPPRRRATIVGTITAGISAGILAGRIAGGLLTDLVGWRHALILFAIACLACAAVAFLVLPAEPGGSTTTVLANLRGLPVLYAHFLALRLAAVRGALWFFAFCAVWSGIAVTLSQEPFSYSSERIGLYALAGLSGVLATQVAGAWTDRVGSRPVILIGLVLAAAAAATLSVTLSSTIITLLALAAFDAGLFAAQVANQSNVLSIDPAASGRFNSAYMIIYFIGGSVGAAYGSASVEWLGWHATAWTCTAAVAFATTITVFADRPASGGPPTTARD